VGPVAVACADIAIVSAFVRRPASAGVMSAVTDCVMTASLSNARSAALLPGVGRNGRERKAERHTTGENKCEPFHGGILAFQ
jgi:hypothetical protein